ncbi:MAG: hypothetical protein H6817_10610 [Phycisphaerales bacterium]|nr:hypothetical protein [Phycisphaerales bacterium]
MTALVALCFVSSAGGDEKTALDQIPEAARTALTKLAAGSTITEVEQERKHGATVYEAEWQANGTTHEASVTADGTLLEMEETIALADAPPAVQAAAANHFGADAKVKVERKTIVLYELEGRANGKSHEVLLTPAGKDVHHGRDHGDDDDADDDDDDDDN